MKRLYILPFVGLLLLFLAGGENLQAQNSKRRRIVEHVVRPNETVYSLAQRYSVSVERVYELNPWARERIKDGDKLQILTEDRDAELQQAKGQPSEHTPSAPIVVNRTATTHTIEAGETLYRVARMYGLSEQELMQANPGVSAESFPIGKVLRLVRRTTSVNRDTITYREESLERQPDVRIMLALPISKTPRYLEFYQGFLMGMNDLKKDGVSINLTVEDAQTDQDVERVARKVVLGNYDLVVGGINEGQIETLAKATRQGVYVLPFASATAVSSPSLVRVNQSPSEVVERVYERFVIRFADRPVYIVRRVGDELDVLALGLKKHLPRVYSLQLSGANVPHLEDNAVIVPANASKELGLQILNSFTGKGITIFGYPQWQSYGADFMTKLHQRGATIFSSFYFDAEGSEGRQFLTKFHAWFDKKLANSYPRYGVLGYDMARYFIRAYASLGRDFVNKPELLPSDGLQLDIALEPLANGGGYVNSRYYLVTFLPDGTLYRHAI